MRDRLFGTPNGLIHQAYIQALVIFFTAVLLYTHTLTHEYALGDRMVFTENEYALRGVDGISDILIHDSFNGFLQQHQEIRAGGQYRPFSIITFAVEYEFFGVNPLVSHAINVFIYALTCLLLLFTLRKMIGTHKLPEFLRSIMPFVATLLFVVHPIHTEVVANVQQRDELLAFFFLLVTTYLVLVGTNKSWSTKLALLPFIVLFFSISLISNEIAVAFLAIIPLILYCFSELRKRELLLLGIPFWITVAVYVEAQRFFALEATQLDNLLNNPFLHASMSEKYATLIFVAGKYLQLLLLPINLSHDYSFNEIHLRTFADPMVWAILLFYAGGMIWATVALLRRRNVISFTFLYFVLSLGIISTVSNIIFPTGTVMSESLLYIPSLGVCIGFVYLIYYSSEHFARLGYRWRHAIYTGAWGLTFVIVATFAFKSFNRIKVWKNDFTLLKEDVHHAPHSAKIRNMLAEEYLNMAALEGDQNKKLGLINEGVSHLKEGIKIYEDNAPAWVLLGNTELALQDYYKAHACYEKAIQIDPSAAEAYRNLSLIEEQRGNYMNSIEYAQQWIVHQNKYMTTKKERSEAFTRLGTLYDAIDSVDFAITAYNTALNFYEPNVQAHIKLGLASERQSGSMTTAIQNFRRALEFEPKNTLVLEHLGLALARKGDYNGGIYNLKRAIRLDAVNPRLYENLAKIYEEMGEEELANSYFRKAEALN